MSEIIIQPDNPMSVLTLFDADKKGLDYFIDYVANTIESGMDNPLKVWTISKKMEYVIEGVRARIKQSAINEAAKHGEHPFQFAGVEVQVAPTRTDYDYASCNDITWDNLAKVINEALAQRKEREAQLRLMKKPETHVDEDTGEVSKINPPVKTQSMGIKVTIK